MGSVLGPWLVGFTGSKIGEVMAHGASAERVKLMGSPWVSLLAGRSAQEDPIPTTCITMPRECTYMVATLHQVPPMRKRKTCAGFASWAPQATRSTIAGNGISPARYSPLPPPFGGLSP